MKSHVLCEFLSYITSCVILHFYRDVFPNVFQQKKELEKWAKIILFYVHFLVIYLILFLLTRVSLLYDHD